MGEVGKRRRLKEKGKGGLPTANGQTQALQSPPGNASKPRGARADSPTPADGKIHENGHLFPATNGDVDNRVRRKKRRKGKGKGSLSTVNG
jgi:hypothetical protein